MQRRLSFVVGALLVALTRGVEGSAADLEERCEQAVQKGIKFIAADQHPNGCFTTYESRVLYPDRKQPFDTPFTATQILYSLSFCRENETLAAIRRHGVEYLVSQKEAPGIWRYKGNRDLAPPDVDDTAMGWAVLKQNGQTIPAQAVDAVRRSRNAEELFNTWMGDSSTWTHIDSKEIDSVININVLFLLGLVGATDNKVCDHITKLAETGEFRHGSLYYPSPWMFTYVFSRAYAEGGVRCLEKALPKIREAVSSSQEPDAGWGDDFETACALLTLLNLREKGPNVERAVKLLLDRQQPDGGWALVTIYTGAPRMGAGRYVYTSRAVTTALCIEALSKLSRK